MNKVVFNPGFRLSSFDVLILITGLISAYFLKFKAVEFSYVMLFVIGHFFYFCNITRMSRIPELIWAFLFIIIYGFGVNFDLITVFEAFFISIIVTITLTILELRKPSYHGIFWIKVNPKLKTWFENQN